MHGIIREELQMFDFQRTFYTTVLYLVFLNFFHPREID